LAVACALVGKELGRSYDPLLPSPAPTVEAAAAEEQDNHNDKKDGCHIHGFLQKLHLKNFPSHVVRKN
jgi:hypothetical protein